MARLTYEEALAVLERAIAFGIHPSLDGMRELTEELGRPQDAFRAVQVTGTNGKTSTVRLTEALLRAEGARTGLYTSPHLERYPERIEVAGAVVSDAEFAQALSAASTAAERTRPGALGTPEGHTEFELLTAAALWLFAERGVEIAVLEVGMGGRWDATSIVDPAVAVITGVGLDHAEVLGDTLEKIAAEKAGIIKPGSRVVLGPGTAVLEASFTAPARAADASVVAVREAGAAVGVARADGLAAEVSYRVTARPASPAGSTRLDVESARDAYRDLAVRAPAYQAPNIATALAAAEEVLGRGLDAAKVRSALRGARVPGRFEVLPLTPPLVLDGAHNPQSAAVLADAIADAWPDPARRPLALLGVLGDKDAAGIVAALAPVVSGFVVTRSSSARALPVGQLAGVVEAVTREAPLAVVEPLGAALAQARGLGADGVVATGSITVAGEVRGLARLL